MPACAPAEREPFRLVGDPIDVVTGAVSDQSLCFRLIGPLVLEWKRLYDSACHRTLCSLGWGHAHAYGWQLAYDADGLCVFDPLGRATGFRPLLRNRDYDRNGGLVLERIDLRTYRLHQALDPVREFVFSSPDAPAGLHRVFRDRSEIRFARNAAGRLAAITHSTGLQLAAEEDTQGRLLRLEGAWDGGATKPVLVCDYDPAGNLTRLTDAFGRSWTFAWDEANRLIRKTDRKRYSFWFQYDEVGRCTRSAGEDGVLGVILRYRSAERITEVTKADGGVWTYFHDASGAVTQTIGPYGNVWKYRRDESGRVVGEIDPSGQALDYLFTIGGSLAAKKFATGRIFACKGGIDRAGPPPHYLPATPQGWELGRLPRLLAASTDAPPAALRAAIPPEAPPLPPSPRVAPFGRNSWYPPPDGGRSFDIFGHLTGQVDSQGRRRHWTYDANDSMERFTDFDGGSLHQVRRSWNQEASATDALGQATLYEWTRQENLLSATDAGGTRNDYAWDQQDRLRGVRRSGAIRESYHYDVAGNLIEKRDGAGNTLVRYVPTKDRLAARKEPASGEPQVFTYDPQGRCLTAATGESATCFAYDEGGNRTLDRRDGDGVCHVFEGRRLRQSTLPGGITLTFADDSCGRKIGLPGGASIRIERLGRATWLRSNTNGTREIVQFDEQGRCLFKGVFSALLRAPWLRRYRLSGEGDLLGVDDSQSGRTDYGYDAAHRLVAERSPDGALGHYAYDAAGNLLARPGLTGLLLADANRLAMAGGERFAYDARGHVASRDGHAGTIHYRYDASDMLVGCTTPRGTWRAEYDALGRRTSVEHDGGRHVYYWDTDRLAAERMPDGSLRVYVYADAVSLAPLAFIDTPDAADARAVRVFYIFADQLGAPLRVEDANGAPVWRARYAPYGLAQIDPASTLRLDLRWPGHVFDPWIGLNCNRFRYYDPALGRYLQADPAGIGGGMNLYATPASPLGRVDLRGLHGGVGGNCPDEGGDAPAEGAPAGEQTATPPEEEPPVPIGEQPRPDLPPFNGITSGVIVPLDPPGDPIPITSGPICGAALPYARADGHLEARAADVMAQNGITNAVIYHNNPGGTCPNCHNYLQTYLEPNSVMTVVPPADSQGPPTRSGGPTRWRTYPTTYVGNNRPLPMN